jgi:tetratricopeptide (TPR) repeat protein
VRKPAVVSVAVLFTTAFLVVPARTADHRDAPFISEDGRADLLDVFGFINPNNGNIVLAATVNPFAIGGAIQLAFGPDVLYEFKIDNTGDNVEDLAIQATFSPTVPGPQTFTIRGPVKPRVLGTTSLRLDSAPSITGPATGVVVTGSGPVLRAFAGLRDDPFFIDLIWVLRLIGAAPGGPLTRAPGIDFFASLNCSILAIEVPPSVLRGPAGNVIRFWASTSRARTTTRSASPYLADSYNGPFIQVDRTALPVINTVLIPPRLKDAFNRVAPTQDSIFRDVAIASLFALNGDRTYSQSLVDALLLPDVATLDLGRAGGFPNGRRPEDDVIDIILQAATRNAVMGDRVDANDVPYLNDFPFFAPPHGPETPIPGRNRANVEIAFLEARVARDDADAITPTWLGHAYLRRAREAAQFTDYTKAEAAFRQALARSPEHFGALTGLANALAARHAFTDAFAVAERAIRASPGVADGYAAAGDAALEAGMLTKAAELYARAARLAPGYDADTRAANLAAARGDTATAYAALAKAAADATARGLGQDRRTWPHIRSGALALEHGDWRRAERSYQTALKIMPDSDLTLEHLAELRAEQGRRAEALDLYGRAIAINPRAEYHAAVGAIHHAQGRADLARAAFDRARRAYLAAAEEGDPGVYRQLALFYADVEPDAGEAVKWARKDLEIRSDPVTLGILAWTLMKSGALDEAGEFAARALQGAPVDALTWYRTALVAIENRDAAEGQARLARALTINPRLKMRIPGPRGRG